MLRLEVPVSAIPVLHERALLQSRGNRREQEPREVVTAQLLQGSNEANWERSPWGRGGAWAAVEQTRL